MCSISLFRCTIKDVTKEIEKHQKKVKIVVIKWAWFSGQISHVHICN